MQAGCPPWVLQMKGAETLQLKSDQPQARAYFELALARPQFSLPSRLLGSKWLPALPQCVYTWP